MMPNTQLRDTKRKAELKKGFKSAKSTNKKLKIFNKTESCFQDKDLVTLANELIEFPAKLLFFGKSALKILTENENQDLPFLRLNGVFYIGPSNHVSSMYVLRVLILLGNACRELKRYDDSSSYLNWANRDFTRLSIQCDSSFTQVIQDSLVQAQRLLDCGKIVMRFEEKLEEEGCIELSEAYKDMYEAFFEAENPKEALPFYLKGLEMCEKYLGLEADDVGCIVTALAPCFSASGEFENALVCNQMSQRAIKNVSSICSDSLKIENGNLLIKLGRNEEAVNFLKGMVSDAATEEGRVSACVFLAKAFVHLENFTDANKYLKRACKIIEKKKKIYPIIVASAFHDMSNLYEMMNDCETALSLLRRALTGPELPVNYLPNCSDRLFSLIISTGNEKEGIRYLEDLVEILKKKCSPAHSEVGYGYKHLGLACANFGQDELAVKFLANAKDIMDVSLGPQHLESLTIRQDLSVSYWNLRRYDLAVDTQEEVVRGLKGLGPSEHECLDEAVGMLNQMKKIVAESSAIVSPQSTDCEDISKTISKCGIADN